jgi:CheY-like chemotaxis protein
MAEHSSNEQVSRYVKEGLDICQVVDSVDHDVDPSLPPNKAEAILIVDDDDLYVRAITRQLRGLGYPYVFRACSATEALDMLQRVRPTIVLTDMVMENREAGRWVLAAAEKLNISAAVVSGMPGLDEAKVGRPVFLKSELDSGRLEQLVGELVAENRAERRKSATFVPTQPEQLHSVQFATRKTA